MSYDPLSDFERPRRPSRLPLLFVGIAAFTAFGWFLGRSEISDPSPAPAPQAAAAPQSACLPVPAEMVELIASGLIVNGGGMLRDAWAVASGAHKQMYFISAEIDGPGMEREGDIGTWASNRLEGRQGILMAVPATATEFSKWPDGSRTDAQLSMSDPGARESQACVRDRKTSP